MLINLTSKEFDPDQPRIPEGEPGAGQWTSGDGSADASILDDLLRMPAISNDNDALQNVADKSKATSDILLPGGKEVGVREKGADDGIGTVSKSEFDNLEGKLLDGAVQLPTQSGYSGTWYRRSDGSIFGLRTSSGSGETIDIKSSSDPRLHSGYKVHSK